LKKAFLPARLFTSSYPCVESNIHRALPYVGGTSRAMYWGMLH
jgi:hypothetical protein